MNRLEIDMSDTEKFVDDVIQEVNSKSNSPKSMELTQNLTTIESIDAVGDI